MKNKTTKIFSIFLTLVMMVGLLPTMALADDVPTIDSPVEVLL